MRKIDEFAEKWGGQDIARNSRTVTEMSCEEVGMDKEEKRKERKKKRKKKHTFGGLPLFLFSVLEEGPAGGGASEAFLFLLPFGRPLPRFTGALGSC